MMQRNHELQGGLDVDGEALEEEMECELEDETVQGVERARTIADP